MVGDGLSISKIYEKENNLRVLGKKGLDMISSLADETLIHVLSFLPIKEAALTCILSKRWMNLFAFTPDLDLCFVDYDFWNPERNKSFIYFVERVLALSGNFTMRKFSLKTKDSVTLSSSHINRWIINVLNRGIRELALDMVTEDVVTVLPLDIFYSKTLVKLELGRYVDITMVPENAFLPSLKTLFLQSIRFSGCAFEDLLSACPVLEELTVIGDHWYWGNPNQSHTISSPTLKRLVFKCISPPLTRSITFDTPSLVYLEYYDYNVMAEYPTVNLISLVEANLNMKIITFESNPTNLISGLRNVEILTLSSVETSEFLYYFAEVIPVFENLSRLSITTVFGHCWRLMPLLIKKAPNLETLVINGPLHYFYDFGSICECLAGYSFLCTCSVKVLEITEYMGNQEELEQMKQFIKKLTCLELVIVHVCKEAKSSSVKDLQRLPTTCKIQLKFSSL